MNAYEFTYISLSNSPVVGIGRCSVPEWNLLVSQKEEEDAKMKDINASWIIALEKHLLIVHFGRIVLSSSCHYVDSLPS